jgi:hypothetical protein
MSLGTLALWIGLGIALPAGGLWIAGAVAADGNPPKEGEDA